jgi:hypothetical protein
VPIRHRLPEKKFPHFLKKLDHFHQWLKHTSRNPQQKTFSD